ncbi:MAG: DUF3135 domain-containing protein [Gammaproteobacteria bacterium]
MSNKTMSFDFDGWKDLAKNDPEAFEAKRKRVIESFISRHSDERQKRLRGLQWRIDIERNKYKHPLMSSQKIFNMMWDSVYGEGGLQEALKGLHNGQRKQEKVSAEVKPFKSAMNAD